jgi:hypothetical protein
METLQALAMKIITDDAFAEALLANPAEVLAAAGVEPTAEMIETIRGIDLEELRNLTAVFSDESKAM